MAATKRVTLSAAGVDVRDEDEAPLRLVGEAVGAAVEPDEPVEVGSVEELLEEFADDADCIKEVAVGKRKFGIKKLSMQELIDVETQRLQVNRHGQIQRNPSREEKLHLALTVSSTVYRRDAKGQWVPMFTVQTAQELFDRPKALEFLDELFTAIYTENMGLHPVMRAAKMGLLNV